MSDSAGYIYDADGIDAEKLAFVMELKNVKRGRISEYVKKYPSANLYEGKTPWHVNCDIALPCATQNELKGEEAKALLTNGCKCVAEGANMPTTQKLLKCFKRQKYYFHQGKHQMLVV